MKTKIHRSTVWIFSGLSLLLAGTPLCYAVTINPGDDIQAAVDANPPGTTFNISAGTYRMQSITAKSNDSFIGVPGTILTGAKILPSSSWIQSGNVWYVTGQTQQGPLTGGQCRATSPRCVYPEDVFFNNVIKHHEPALSSVGPGSWFFDYDADRIYVGDDPTAGALVETSVTTQAFGGVASGVTISNMVIEKYAGTAIAAGNTFPTPTAWTILNNEIRYNHQTGVWSQPNETVRGNYVHHNGCNAFAGAGGGILVENNEMAYNNTVGNDAYWNCGGSKWVYTNNLIVRGNYAHNNDGPGLWTDINNINVLYENNTSEDNSHDGIVHEISYAAIIRGNTLRRNGTARDYPGWSNGAGIQILDSPNVEIYNNTLVDNWQGITCLNDGRSDPSTENNGPWGILNLKVHDNTVIQTTNLGAGSSRTGCIDAFDPSNTFVNDTYYLGTSANYFMWSAGDINETQWVADGQDVGGHFYRNTVPPTGNGPVISAVAASPVTPSGATISWTTDETADSQVNYGLTTAYGQSTTLDSTLVLSHSQVLSSLTANTLYHYQVKSNDGTTLTTSGDFTFTTGAAPGVQSPYTGTPAVIPGTIEAENFDNGGEGVAYHDTDAGNDGGLYRSTDVDIKAATDGTAGYAIGWFATGEWLEYTVQVAKTSSYTVGLRIGSAVNTGQVHVEFDGVDATGILAVPNTGNYDIWQTLNKTGVTLTAGTHVMRVYVDAQWFDLNSIIVTEEIPVITLQPQNQSVTAGQTATFTITATGAAPLTYQWQSKAVGASNFAAITGATSATLSLPSVALSANGTQYRCVVTNTPGTTTSNPATLSVTAAAVPPSIIQPPQSLTITVGQPAVFNVSVNGTQPFTYQWQVAASGSSTFADISGATQVSYTQSSVTPSLNGNQYRVKVTNTAGSLTSPVAILTVAAATIAPTFQVQPQNSSTNVGGNISFQVIASGTQPMTYEWKVKAPGAAAFSDISGATGPIYTFFNAALTDSGTQFQCIVSNIAGSVTSQNAALTVVPQGTGTPALILLIPLSGSTITGDIVTAAYYSAGNLSGVDHIDLQLDSNTPVQGLSLSGTYNFTSVPAGPHILNVHLATSDDTAIAGTTSQTTFTTQSNSTSGGPLPMPVLNFPSFVPVNGTLTAGYPAGYGTVEFSWTITPKASSLNSSGLQSSTSGTSGAPSASFQTINNIASLSNYNLVPGVYTVSVQAFTNGVHSASAQQDITLVASDLSSVHVFPNPWRSDKHAANAFVTFAGLTGNTTIKIFTVSGHWLKTLTSSAGTVNWDLTNDQGDKVASGDYVYLITAEGQKKTGQVVVIK